jgi:hypothetical protein
MLKKIILFIITLAIIAMGFCLSARAEHIGKYKASTNIKTQLADTGGGATLDKVYAERQDGNYAQISGAPLTVTTVIANKSFTAAVATGASQATGSILWKFIHNDIVTAADDTGTATSSTASVLTDSGASWTPDAYIEGLIEITGGTGSGQLRDISDNDGTTITVSKDFTVTPDGTSTYGLYLPANVTMARDTFTVTTKLNDDLSTEIAAISGGAGSASVIVSIKDGAAADVEGVKVSVHNAANSETIVAGPFTTDSSGDTATFNVNDATYTTRLYKSGAVSENQSIVVSGSATHELVVTVTSPSNPSDPGVCRLRAYVTDLDNTDTTGTVTIKLSGSGSLPLQKVDGRFLRNSSGTFTLDTTTDPDSYIFDAVRGAKVVITGTAFGMDHRITVPDQAAYDLATPLE